MQSRKLWIILVQKMTVLCWESAPWIQMMTFIRHFLNIWERNKTLEWKVSRNISAISSPQFTRLTTKTSIAMLVCGIVSILTHLLQIVSTCGNVFKNIPSVQQCKLSAITSNQFTSRPISLHACFVLFLRKVLQHGPQNDNSSRLACSPVQNTPFESWYLLP